MSDLGSIEDHFDSLQQGGQDSNAHHTRLNGTTQIGGIGTVSEDPSGWRPFGLGFKIPAWGRRSTTNSNLSRSNSESRLSVASSTGSNGDLKGELGRTSDKRSSHLRHEVGTRENADGLSLIEDSEHHDIRTLSELTARFASLIIPGDIADADQQVLQTRIEELQTLQQDVLAHIDTNDLETDEKARTLLEAIVEEIGVYGEFLESSESASGLGILAKNGEETDDVISYGSSAQTPDDMRSSGSQTFEDSTSDACSDVSGLASPPVQSPATQPPRPLSHFRRISTSTVASGASLSSSTIPSTAAMSASNLSVLAGQTVPPGPKDVLRWTSLQKLSMQLMSGAMRQKVGVPTVLSISGGILIGTSWSMILVYDFAQVLKTILGDPADASNPGPVTAVALAPDHNQLACGYAHGLIRVWDIQRRAIVKSIIPIGVQQEAKSKKDGHAQGAAIIHLAFIGTKGAFVSGDNQGSAFYHASSKGLVMSTQVSTRIHPSSSNPAVSTTLYALSALPRVSGHLRYPGDHLDLIALSTPYKMAIISLKPAPQTQFRLSWTRGSTVTNPSALACSISCLAWCPPSKQDKHGKIPVLSNPLLACSFGKQLRIIRVSWVSTAKRSKRDSVNVQSNAVDYSVQGSWVANDDIVALQWMDDKLLLCLTSLQELILFDATIMREIERSDVSMRQIISSDYYTRSLQSLRVTPAMAYHQSIRSYKGRLFVLGQRELTVASRLSWTDRLKALVVSGNFQEAIAMGLTFYYGSAKRAVIGLPPDDEMRRTMVGDHLTDLLLSFINMSLTSYDASDQKLLEGEDISVFRQLAATAFDTCLAIGRDDLLFGDIYENFGDKNLRVVFFELLEAYVLDERITTFSNPVIVQEFIAFYEMHGWLDRLEQVILHLDPMVLDVHHTVGLCLKYGLYSGLLYVYNRVGDFVTPIIELLHLLELHGKARNDKGHSNGNGSALSTSIAHSPEDAVYTLYVYLAYILTGKAFPVGHLDEKEAVAAREDVFSFLFSPFHAIWPPGTGACKLGREPYPYIHLLLSYDPREFLKALGAIVADDALQNKDLKIRPNVFVADEDGMGRFADRYEISRQFILNALISAVEGSSPPSVDILSLQHGESIYENNVLDPRDVTLCFCFVARIYANYRSTVSLQKDVLRRVLLCLMTSPDSTTREERQRAIVGVLLTGFEPSNAEQDKWLDLYQQGGLWRPYELAARKLQRYELVILSYLNDPTRQEQGFHAIYELLESEALAPRQSLAVKQSVLQNVVQLTHIDEVATTDLMSTFWPTEHKAVIRTLSPNADDLFTYLRGLLDAEWALSLRKTADRPRRRRPKQSTSTTDLGEEVYEKYIELLCIREPREVKRYLDRLSVDHTGYPYAFDRVLALCKQHNVLDAAVWILEKSGNLEGALRLIMEGVQVAVEIITNTGNRSGETSGEITSLNALEHIKRRIDMALDLCMRSSGRLGKDECESLWFSLLDAIVEPQKVTAPPSPTRPEGGPLSATFDDEREPKVVELYDCLKNSARTLLYAMVGYVPFHSILYRIVQSQRRASFGEHREIIFSMLDSYSYERELLQATNRILSIDVHGSQARSTSLRRKALRPFKGQCGVCKRMLHIRAMSDLQKINKIAVMKCGHAFHATCLQTDMERIASMEGWETAGDAISGSGWCVICAKNRDRAKAAAKKLTTSSAERTKEKGKDKMAVVADAEEPPDTQQKQQVQRANAELFVRLSSHMPTNEIYRLLHPHRASNVEDMINMNDDVIDLGESPYDSVYGDGQSAYRRGSEFPSHQIQHIPSSIVKTPHKYFLSLAPPSMPPSIDSVD
ncbi:CORVET complex membrane-binding subunit VPS8 [Spizellomyces punctatus DAOM BR117]|uniref:RING-type domain-containing protein n=1 Tax=Spizellomyces punctatus (strain DAOM BR117) TaxID=645134 RepID=A0A0L0HBQ4_SPIPD|nr:CORVET complex membrane-binding subunit VPS8 [Spizellomyces punctatus DAOM BR117]KNC99020.1 hypothetical protein SPPG_05970 [Spizellomyces punctatus DAOM BR117]|eukprot:XP_016607060.1 hypothetical protein SPPG_05970 [Spizellomyces punctatus DAOM BR117]